uniref:Uncharacterized protein n=1 Tax=Poecilia mexicana TaxID=48701 RepID=A0A3B3WL07_9TELE
FLDPVTEDPVRGDPVTEDPVRGDPVRGDPVTEDPVRGDPVRGPSQRGPKDPVRGDPVRGGPVTEDPVRGDPVRGPSQRGPSQRGPSQRGPSHRGPSQRGPSQRGPSQRTQSQRTQAQSEGTQSEGPVIVTVSRCFIGELKAVQRHAVRPPAGGEHRPDLLHRQRGSVRHLLPHAEADHAHLRRPEPPGVGHHERRHHLAAVPRAAQRRPAEAGRQHGSLPQAALLHAGLRPADGAGQPAVPGPLRPGAHPADVRRPQHDGGLRPAPRPLPHRCGGLPRADVHEGGGRPDAERPEQEQQLLRGVDPQQREGGRVRHPAARPQDGRHVHRKQHRHPGTVQTDLGAVLGHVPPEGLPALVHRGRHGRDGVHRGGEQHERPGVRVPAVPGGLGPGGRPEL